MEVAKDSRKRHEGTAMSSKAPMIRMKRSKSSNPILVSKSSQTLMRHKSFLHQADEKDNRNSQGDQPCQPDMELKLQIMYSEAQALFDKGEYENAFIKFGHGAKLDPKNKSFQLGIKKSKNAIISELTSSSDTLKQLQDEINRYPVTKPPVQQDISVFPPKVNAISHPVQTDESEISDLNEVKSETMKAAVSKVKEKKLEPTYNLTINDGTCYRTITATAQDVKEYLKDKSYFKVKDQTKKDWKKLRSEFNKKIAEREAAQRYEREAKLLEEKSQIRHHCEEQISLIGRHYQNGKMTDVIRFSENFIKYLNKKAYKALPRKWIYLATAFNYLARANADRGDYDKAKTFGEKLYRIAITSGNTELIAQSYILSGKIYVKFERYKEAAFVWEKLVPLVTDDERKAWLFHEIGRCYFELGKYDSSLKHGSECVHWAGKCNSSTWISAGNVLLGQVEMKKNNIEEASKRFAEAKKHAEIIDDEQTLKYINSVQEILNVVLRRNRVKASEDAGNIEEDPASTPAEEDLGNES